MTTTLLTVRRIRAAESSVCRQRAGAIATKGGVTSNTATLDVTEATSCGGNKAPCTMDEDCCSLNCGRDGKCKGGSGGGGAATEELAENSFRRGDPNRDGAVDISDSLFTLNYLFVGSRSQ